jgi:Putative addiction module component
MSPQFDRLRQEAASLDEVERAQLALDLLESLEPQGDPDTVERLWNEEAERRVAQFDRGEMPTVSAEELHAADDLQRRN